MLQYCKGNEKKGFYYVVFTSLLLHTVFRARRWTSNHRLSMSRDHYKSDPALVTFLSAPASWPPAAGCYSTPLRTAQRLGSLPRPRVAPPAHQGCPARAPAMFQAQCGPQTHQEAKCGHWTPTSTPVEQPPCPQFRRPLLCRIPLLRTHNHQVSSHCPHTGLLDWN